MASVFVVGELEAGAADASSTDREQARVRALLQVVTVVYPDERFAPVYGDALVTLQRKGKTVDTMDLLIATGAVVDSAALVTANRRHFDDVKANGSVIRTGRGLPSPYGTASREGSRARKAVSFMRSGGWNGQHQNQNQTSRISHKKIPQMSKSTSRSTDMRRGGRCLDDSVNDMMTNVLSSSASSIEARCGVGAFDQTTREGFVEETPA